MQAVDRQVPDAMVLDLMMPEMDGFEVLHALRAHPLAAAVPVFIWTSLILTPQEQELLAGSARAILAKGDGALAAVLDSLRLWQPMPVLSVGPA